MSYAAAAIGAGATWGIIPPCTYFTLTLRQSASQHKNGLPAGVQLGLIGPYDANGLVVVDATNTNKSSIALPTSFSDYDVVLYQVQGSSTTGPCAPTCPPGQVMWNGKCITPGNVGGKIVFGPAPPLHKVVGGTFGGTSAPSGWSTKKKVAVIGGSVLALGLVAGGVWWVVR